MKRISIGSWIKIAHNGYLYYAIGIIIIQQKYSQLWKDKLWKNKIMENFKIGHSYFFFYSRPG